jgi:hypothetical protein
MPNNRSAIVHKGTDSIDLVVALLERFTNIKAITLSVVSVPPSKTSRPIARDPTIQSLNDEALNLRAKYNVPYWMAVFLTAQSRRVVLPQSVIHATAFHQPMVDADNSTVEATTVTADYLRKRCGKIPDGHVLTISSEVTLNDLTLAHVPMLDFRISPSQEGLSVVSAVLDELGIGGIVLNSGRSYHFYGQALLPAEQLRCFLGKALLFTPIIDYRWIAHQLIEGACALRISPGTSGQDIPRAVKVISFPYNNT